MFLHPNTVEVNGNVTFLKHQQGTFEHFICTISLAESSLNEGCLLLIILGNWEYTICFCAGVAAETQWKSSAPNLEKMEILN